tara:strand:+ start:1141 stop:1641 length:501 start_codon:yes stop_codon:yes gene_type:complete
MKLNEFHHVDKSSKNKKRIGRGIGSGTGKTSGKGHKGQKSRSGVSIKGFEGGQMPIHRRLPKRGFTNIFRKEFIPINLGSIQKLIEEKKLPTDKILNADLFVKAGLIKKANSKIKILANGKFKNKIEVEAFKFSNSAKLTIEKNGGKALLIQSKSETKISNENKKV